MKNFLAFVACLAITGGVMWAMGVFGHPKQWGLDGGGPAAASPLPTYSPSFGAHRRGKRHRHASPAAPPGTSASPAPRGALNELGLPGTIEAAMLPTKGVETASVRATAGAFASITAKTLSGLTSERALGKAGYRRVTSVVWVNETALQDGRVLDPEAPEMVVIVQGRPIGALFVSAAQVPPTPVGAPVMRWMRMRLSTPFCLAADGVMVSPPCGSDAHLTSTTQAILPVWTGPGMRPYAPVVPANVLKG